MYSNVMNLKNTSLVKITKIMTYLLYKLKIHDNTEYVFCKNSCKPKDIYITRPVPTGGQERGWDMGMKF